MSIKQKSHILLKFVIRFGLEDRRFLPDFLRTLRRSFQRGFCRLHKCITNVKKPLSSLTIYLRVSVQNLEVYLKNSYDCFIRLRMCFALQKPAFFNLRNVLESLSILRSHKRFKQPFKSCRTEKVACNPKRKMGSNTTQQ